MSRHVGVAIALVLLFAVAHDAQASCVGCLVQSCVNRRGVEVQAAMCDGQDVDYGYGVDNCKNLACNGCMGWSCNRDGEVPLSELAPETTTIERTPERDTAATESTPRS